MPTRAVAGPDLGTRGGDVDVPLMGGPSGTAYSPDSCAVVLFENCCRPREPAGSCLRSSIGIHRILVRLTATAHSNVWSALLHGTRDAAELRKAVHRLLQNPRKKNRPLRCWRLRLLRESQAAQRNTRFALCLEPVLASVAPVSLSSQLAQSHQGAMCLPANLSTVPKYLQSWLQIWKSPEAHTHWRKNSEWIRAWQQRRRRYTEALIGGGSGGSTN